MNLVSRVKNTSDRDFKVWLSCVTELDKARLLEIRDGLQNREVFISQHDGIRFLPYMSTLEKVNFIKTCYGWVFAKIEEEFPIAARDPEQASSFTWHMVNVSINHLFLPEDQQMLILA